MIHVERLTILSFIVGFIGDALLQIGSIRLGMGGPTGWGLKGYFKQHGHAESMCIAGGMMIFFYIVYALFSSILPDALPFDLLHLAIYGVLLDLLFRKTMVFPSLKGYYQYFNYFWSAVWGAIPLMLPLIVYQLYEQVVPLLNIQANRLM